MLKPFHKTVLLLLCLMSTHALTAQNSPVHLGRFDERKVHFGIQVGYTQSKFDLHYTDDDAVREDILGTTSYYSPGFHINQINDFRLGDHLNLRLMPGITLISRDMAYVWSDDYTSTHWKYDTHRSVESVYGELPVEFKFRAMRYSDFRPYLIAGASGGFDFASLFKNRNNNDESIIRLKPWDIRYTMGVGFDFFLPYVKFAIELKMAFGIVDLRVVEDDIYTQSIDYLNSRTFMLSFTFQG